MELLKGFKSYHVSPSYLGQQRKRTDIIKMTPGEVTSTVLKGSALGPVLPDKFQSGLEDEMGDTVQKLPKDSK